MNSINKNISIILPTLNERENLENLIPEFISNLGDNNYENYEILVIDDNSTDGTKEYIESLKDFNSKINIIVRKVAKVERAHANLLLFRTATISENIKGVITISIGKFLIINDIIFNFYLQDIFHDIRLNLMQKFHLH